MAEKLTATTRTPTSRTFNYGNADVILRSSDRPDQIDFRVHKLILSLSSPFFETMFTLPNAPQQVLVDELPVVDMSESATVIGTLLRIIYPIPDPPFNTLNADVVDAAHKFEMEAAFGCLRRYLTDRIALRKEPLKMYAIAVTYNLKEEAKLASSYTLRFNIIDEPLPEEMKKISVQDYHRLLVLHRTRGKAIEM
ncbi:hypothetical protein ABKN59_007465 [Abortiporus biennis]